VFIVNDIINLLLFANILYVAKVLVNESLSLPYVPLSLLDDVSSPIVGLSAPLWSPSRPAG
jgi:hypothetical protein